MNAATIGSSLTLLPRRFGRACLLGAGKRRSDGLTDGLDRVLGIPPLAQEQVRAKDGAPKRGGVMDEPDLVQRYTGLEACGAAFFLRCPDPDKLIQVAFKGA